MPHRPDYETMFNPKSVAIIGASTRPATGNGPNGSNFINTYRELGFAGRIYPVNPKASEILGLKAYPNIGSLPEIPDFVIISVPVKLVPQTLIECADAGVKNIHIFTAGFRETGEAEGIELERQIKKIATERELSVIGPNGMGLYVPKVGICTWAKAPKESGPIAFISQSGGIANEL
ncbi:MAG: CoA-binding protein, partial [Dehalococcoidia bacterium]|nr:CoA-binding protein [Dehalococcoidia bacterium]